MEVEDLPDAVVLLLAPPPRAEQVAQQHGPEREAAVPQEAHQERVQVPRARRDVEDRVHPGGEVLVELDRPGERRAGERGAGEGLDDHPYHPLDAGLEDRVVDIRDDPEAGIGGRDAYVDRRSALAAHAAVVPTELDRSRCPRALEGVRRCDSDQEVAVAVGGCVDAGTADRDPEGDAGELVGQEVPHGSARSSPDPLAVHCLGGQGVVQHATAYDDARWSAVADVGLDPEVLGRPGATAAQPDAVPRTLCGDDQAMEVQEPGAVPRALQGGDQAMEVHAVTVCGQEASAPRSHASRAQESQGPARGRSCC